ncbi:3-oxoacyl-ACP synthase [Massilia antarctica]|uniref:3-oxoacyl-ACP synthase n=1 Tax=Massilia antarctica TaxID=2765360 RepID=A0AA48WII9_9BURK|nr:3-oxoacyl-[acyl-carrier-protein] synthase III C-terminal domain-containing protein [Massilia antarctica]QPI52244.1 3-oxoacyl-ACP synthase [Massilia antarctica]
MIRPVYLGAPEYAAGSFVTLDSEIADSALCAQLRHAEHGANFFPQCGSSIFELVDTAIQRSLASARLQAQDIDAVFLVSNMLDAQDNLEPGWLGELNARLGLSHTVHYQVGMAGCGGFHWAARLAASLIAAGECTRILIVSFDKAGGKLQRLYGAGTDFPYVTGDAAAACILSSEPDGMDYRLLGKVINRYDGRQILAPSLDSEMRCISQLIKATYASAELKAKDIDVFITNNYSYAASQLYCQLASLSYAIAYTGTIATHAHCFSSDNLINLHHLAAKGEVGAGARLLLFSTGPFQWGACILEKLDNGMGQ